MSRKRKFAPRATILANRNLEEKGLTEGDIVYTRLIEDNKDAIKRSKIDSKELTSVVKNKVIELHKQGVPIQYIMYQTGLSLNTINNIIAIYMTANKPENLILELMKDPTYQHKPNLDGTYTKHLFDADGIYYALRDKISWTKQTVVSYITNISEDAAKRRANKIRDCIRDMESELEGKAKLRQIDIKRIAKQVGTHHEIVELEFQLVGGRDDYTRRALLAKKYKLTMPQIYELDIYLNDPKFKTNYGINFVKIAMTLEDKFGKQTQLSLESINNIYRTEYQKQN